MARDFTKAYEGTPPWDIGRPQGAFVALAAAGKIQGAVLDAGCGTGENALYLAGLGFEVTGIDAVPAAIAKAQVKADEHGLATETDFRVHDALHLETLEKIFDTVIDSGLFHTFDDAARLDWVKSLGRALRPGGHYFMLCFSELEPGDDGPRRVTQDEIRQAFAGDAWHVESIVAARLESQRGSEGVQAWLATVGRVAATG